MSGFKSIDFFDVNKSWHIVILDKVIEKMYWMWTGQVIYKILSVFIIRKVLKKIKKSWTFLLQKKVRLFIKLWNCLFTQKGHVIYTITKAFIYTRRSGYFGNPLYLRKSSKKALQRMSLWPALCCHMQRQQPVARTKKDSARNRKREYSVFSNEFDVRM